MTTTQSPSNTDDDSIDSATGINWSAVSEAIAEQCGQPDIGLPKAPRVDLEDILWELHPGEMPGKLINLGLDAGALIEHEPKSSTDESSYSVVPSSTESDPADSVESPDKPAFEALIEFWHGRVDDEIPEHVSERNERESLLDAPDDHDRPYIESDIHDEPVYLAPRTAREYWTRDRGWSDETVDDLMLGWAPADDHAEYEYLSEQGYTWEDILATGAFWLPDDATKGDPLPALWNGRYVLPYFDGEGQPAYAVSRCTRGLGGGAVGYGGHPADGMSGKYAKLAHTKDYVDDDIQEPIYGVWTLNNADEVIIAEGIADAITAIEAGYNVLSPVTTQFKRKHINTLVDLLTSSGVERVYVIPDSEEAQSSRLGEDAVSDDASTIGDYLHIDELSPGRAGGLRTAMNLAEEGIEARFVQLPQFGEKTDLDDFLQEFGRAALDASIRSARPPEQVPGAEKLTMRESGGDVSDSIGGREVSSEGSRSAIYDLDLVSDVLPAGWDSGTRGKNPLGHKGNSENYATVIEGEDGDSLLKDYKRMVSYNPLTYLLVDAGERPAANPGGDLTNEETFTVWRHAKEEGIIDSDDPIPRRAMAYIANRHGLADSATADTEYSREEYSRILDTVEEEYGVDSGRRSDGFTWEFDADEVSPYYTFPAAYVADDASDEDLPEGFVLSDDGQHWTCEVHSDWMVGLALVAVVEDFVAVEDLTMGFVGDLDVDDAARLCAIAQSRYGFAGRPPYQSILGVADLYALDVDEDGKVEDYGAALDVFEGLCETA